MKNILKNWKTTAAGLIAIILLLLTNVGVISANESQELNTGLTTLISHIDGIIAGVLSVALIFSKDADSKE